MGLWLSHLWCSPAKGRVLLCCILCGMTLLGCRKADSTKDKERVVQYKEFSDLKDKKIGILTGSAYEESIKDYMPSYEAMSYSQLSMMVVAVETGKIDAFIVDAPVARFLLLQRPKLIALKQTIPVGDYAMAMSKNQTVLCKAISDEIEKMDQDGRLKALQDKWFSLDENKKVLPSVKPSDKKLRVVLMPELEPFEYIKDGQMVGYEVDLIMCVAQQLGYEVELARVDFANIIAEVTTGRADVACATIMITPERSKSVLFTAPVYKGGITVVVRNHQATGKEASSVSGKLILFFNSMKESFYKTFLVEQRWKLVLEGLVITILVTFASILLGTLLAFPLCLICRRRGTILSRLGEKYISLMMGTPILVVLMILYYVVFASVVINAICVAVLAFALNFAAYASVMLRSALDGVPRGQTEAALALGHTPRQSFFRVVLPQAIRTMLPVYCSECISTLKGTSIVGYIAIMDMTKAGDLIRSRTYEAFFPLISIALIYFLVSKAVNMLLAYIEKRLDPKTHRDRLMQEAHHV